MRALIAMALGLSLTGQAYSQDLSSNLQSSFYSQNANQQNNYAFGTGTASRSTFSPTAVTCDSPKLTVGVIPTWNDGWNAQGTSYGGNDGVTAGISLTVPFGGTVDRCKAMQKTIIRAAARQDAYNSIMMCAELAKKGIIVDPTVFNFADQCTGVTLVSEAQGPMQAE